MIIITLPLQNLNIFIETIQMCYIYSRYVQRIVVV